MEINLNSGITGTHGEAFDARTESIGREVAEAKPATGFAGGVRMEEGGCGLVSAEPTAEVPAGALARDDALGKLVCAAFNLPAPPMPHFGE